MKKNLTKIFSISLVAVMAAQVSTFGASEYFKDVTSKYDWAQAAIDALYEEGVISGYDDGYFRPADTIKRCDFLVMLYKQFGEEGSYIVKLAEDIERGIYYDEAYIWAANVGMADPSELFNPTDAITRQDAFDFLYKCLEENGAVNDTNKSSDLSKFSDAGDVDSDKKEAVGTLVSLGIVSGSDGLILPKSTMTRAEMAIIFYKAGDVEEEAEITNNGLVVDGNINVDVDSADSKYTIITSVDTNYLVDGTEAVLKKEDVTVTDKGKSGIIITNGGSLNMENVSVAKSGDSASSVNTGTSGVNSAIMVSNNSSLYATSSEIKTYGMYSNGVSIFGGGNTIILDGCDIVTIGDNSAGILTVDNSVLSVINTAVRVNGTGVPAVSLNGADGAYTIKDTEISATGEDVQALTTSGNLTISGSKLSSSSSVGLQSIGSTTLTIDDTEFLTAGAFIEITDTTKNASDSSTKNTTNITDCELVSTSTDQPIIDVVNVNSDIYITGCTFESAGTLLRSRLDKTVNAGAKGGVTNVTFDNQDAEGTILAGSNASVNIVLKNGSVLKTALNTNNSGVVNIILSTDDDKLELTGDCYVGYIYNHDDYGFSNIADKGHRIYYDPNLDENDWLNGDSYSLPNGGLIEPF
ncbi:MAG: S-layer homology domain-containing protein [Clostridiales bacterium]|nr:S-layer homology domain-containing protein [Clostridiales bacterium]